MIEFFSMTFGASTITLPRMSQPSMTVPAVVMFRSPLWTVSFVPAGTPVFVGPGWVGVGGAGGVSAQPVTAAA